MIATRHAITLRDAMSSLGSLCLLQYTIDEKTTVTKLPLPNAKQAKILTALGVTLSVSNSTRRRLPFA